MICTFEIVSHLCITIGKCSQPVKRSTQTLATYQHHLSHNLYGLTSSTSPGQPSHPRSLYAANSACTGRKQTASHTAHDVGVFHNTCLRALEDSSATRCTHHRCTLYLAKHATHPSPLETRAQLVALPQTSNGGHCRQIPGHSWATDIGPTASRTLPWLPHIHASCSGSIQHLPAESSFNSVHITLSTSRSLTARTA